MHPDRFASYTSVSARTDNLSQPLKMADRGYGNQCYASCPASTVTIQPPPFVLTIPGPALYCPDQPLAIEQYNPCAQMGTYGGGGSSSLYASGVSNFYSRALPSNVYNYSYRSSF